MSQSDHSVMTLLLKERDELLNEIKCISCIVRHSDRKERKIKTLHNIIQLNDDDNEGVYGYFSHCERCLKYSTLYMEDQIKGRTEVWDTLNRCYDAMCKLDGRITLMTCKIQ